MKTLLVSNNELDASLIEDVLAEFDFEAQLQVLSSISDLIGYDAGCGPAALIIVDMVIFEQLGQPALRNSLRIIDAGNVRTAALIEESTDCNLLEEITYQHVLKHPLTREQIRSLYSGNSESCAVAITGAVKKSALVAASNEEDQKVSSTSLAVLEETPGELIEASAFRRLSRRARRANNMMRSSFANLKKIERPTPERKTFKILLIESNQADTRLIKKMLDRESPGEFQFEHTSEISRAIDLLNQRSYDVIALGLDQQVGSLESFHRIRETSPGTPVVVLSDEEDKMRALKTVRMGAQDYLVKHPDRYGEVLSRVLKYAIERNRAERLVKRAIEAEHKVLCEVINMAPLLIFRIDRNFNVLDVNNKSEEEACLSSDEMVGKHISNVLRELDLNALARVFTDQLPYSNPELRVSSIGKSKKRGLYLEVFGWPIGSREDGAEELILMCADASERMALNNQRDEFIAALAHDIRNPVVGSQKVIEGITSGALGDLNEIVRDTLESIHTSNKSLLMMLDNLVEIYGLESGGLLYNTITIVRMENLLEEILEEMRYLTLGGDSQFELIVSPNVPSIRADVTSLKRVIQNLLYNAVKYGTPGCTVRVGLSSDGRDIFVSVCNQGTRITSDSSLGVFQRYSSGKNRYSHSTGLGLYLCKKIVEGHGGSIRYENTDESNIFTIVLPTSRNLHTT